MIHWTFSSVENCSNKNCRKLKAKIVRQIQGMARDSIVYDQITHRLRDRHVIFMMSCLMHTLPRRYPSPRSNSIWVFQVRENASETDNLLLCAACMKGQPGQCPHQICWTLSRVHMRQQLRTAGQSTLSPRNYTYILPVLYYYSGNKTNLQMKYLLASINIPLCW